MDRTLTIDDAARLSGRSPREIRLLIESGRLAGERVAGRWRVRNEDLTRDLAPARPAIDGSRPLGAHPEPDPASVPALGLVREPPEAVAELLRRLEEAAVELAAVRDERDSLRTRLCDEVEALEQSYSRARDQLEEARARIAELEARGLSETVKGSTRGQGARAALNPLFQATAPPGRA
jgi:helix-turn-helix protein